MTTPTEAVYSVLKYVVPGNLISEPNNQAGVGYVNSFATITENTTIAPDGTLTADTIDDQNAGQAALVTSEVFTITPSTSLHYLTLFVKEGTAAESYVVGRLQGGSSGEINQGAIDWTASPPTISWSTGTGTFVADENGFYKIVMSVQGNGTDDEIYIGLAPASVVAADTGSVISWGWSISIDVPGRAYSILMPQDPTVPAVTFQKVSAERQLTMTDAGGNGVERDRIRVTSWAKTLSAAQAVAEQVRLAMKAATTFEALQVFEADDHETETLLYSVVSDYSVWYKY